jgi:hypothetical protein
MATYRGKEAGDRSWTRRTGTGYKAGVVRVRKQWILRPDTHSGTTAVNPARAGGKYQFLPREVCKAVDIDGTASRLQGSRCHETLQKSAEAVVAAVL